LTTRKPRIAIVGGGIGGTTLAIQLQRAGYPCKVYEQAPAFARVGAGINLAPNSTRIFRELGLEPQMKRVGVQARLKFSREWDSGKFLFTVPVPELVERYGAPFFAFHRGDLQDALSSALEPGTIEFNKRLVGLSGTKLAFADGTSAEADAVVGADGVHSRVRDCLFGAMPPSYHGLVAYRAIFPTSLVAGLDLDDNTKWWAPDRYFLIYFMSEKRDEVYVVTGSPEPWPGSDFTPRPAKLEEVHSAFAGFHPIVQRVINAATSVSKWPMLELEPFRPWSKGRVVLMGDAAHATTPHMGQGAGMALEDTVILARCMESTPELEKAFQLFEATRFDRTARIQRESHKNEWTRTGMDHSWVYGYDVYSAPLGVPQPQPAHQP
jgi:6-hydroxynicotinate 3-monooxygenase